MSSNTILTREALADAVEYFSARDAFSFDVESWRDNRGVPSQNTVNWLSMATQGRAIAIPFGHPNGTKRIGTWLQPRTDRTGVTKNFRMPEWEPAPEQLRTSEVFAAVRPLFFSDRTMIAHNATFDLVSVTKYFGELPSGPATDTIVMQWLLDENRKRRGLKDLVRDYYGVDYDEEGVGKRVEDHPFAKVAHYAYMDAKYTWLLYQRFLPLLEKQGVQQIYDLENDVLKVICKMNLVGATIDTDALEELEKRLAVRIVEIEGDIYARAGQRFNLNAPSQKSKVLYAPKSEGGQGLKVRKLTKGGYGKQEKGLKVSYHDYSTDSETLESYSSNALVASMLSYSETDKMLNTYVRGYLGDTTVKDRPCRIFGGRIHSDFVQYGTVTGRFCVAPDTLVEMPRDLAKHPDGIPLRDVKPGDWVYSFTWDKRLVLRQVKWVGPTKVADTVIVTIQDRDGKVTRLTCTPDHLVRKWTGEWVAAGLLKEDDRLMGMLPRQYTDSGHAFFPPSKKRALPGKETGGKVYEHRWIYEAATGHRPSTKSIIHHVDHNEINNHWSNLQCMPVGEHVSHHKRTSPERIQAMLDGAPLTVHPKTLQRAARRYDLSPTNHTVISVEPGPRQMQLWDLEIDDTHTFIGSDVALHNSCREPNLQNIPTPDTELGKEIRGLFIAPPGQLLVVADYAQIELVVLAHYIGRGPLYKGFYEGIDAHTVTAAAVFAVEPSEVTKTMRSVAKGLNFAIVYGAGPDKVSLMAGVPVNKAKQFMGQHQKMFPEIYAFKEEVVSQCRKNKPPHIETLLGRKRRLPAIKAQNLGLRKGAERQAVNSLIQGSAADIIKLAMCRLDRLLPPDMHLILTVHDELVVSVPKDRADEGERLVREAMEGPEIAKLLRVPLRAGIKVVDRWSEAK